MAALVAGVALAAATPAQPNSTLFEAGPANATAAASELEEMEEAARLRATAAPLAPERVSSNE